MQLSELGQAGFVITDDNDVPISRDQEPEAREFLKALGLSTKEIDAAFKATRIERAKHEEERRQRFVAVAAKTAGVLAGAAALLVLVFAIARRTPRSS